MSFADAVINYSAALLITHDYLFHIRGEQRRGANPLGRSPLRVILSYCDRLN